MTMVLALKPVREANDGERPEAPQSSAPHPNSTTPGAPVIRKLRANRNAMPSAGSVVGLPPQRNRSPPTHAPLSDRRTKGLSRPRTIPATEPRRNDVDRTGVTALSQGSRCSVRFEQYPSSAILRRVAKPVFRELFFSQKLGAGRYFRTGTMFAVCCQPQGCGSCKEDQQKRVRRSRVRHNLGSPARGSRR